NGQQAWKIIQKQELDIVITDVMMPVMDGIELTQTIKQSTDYGQLPVVMLTAKTRDEDRNAAFGIGADEYITKPFNIEDLKVRIDNIIANRQRIRDRFSRQTDFDVSEQHYSNPDEVFLKRAIECVKANIGEYDRESFAQDMCLSSSSLYNKLRAVTGQNITSFISSVRLKEACRIAKQEPNIKVAELGMRVGFSTPKYFTKVFKDEFGFSPSEYLEKIRKGQ
ncbi:MAG: response regulator, partial [Prevotella sp.]|nr:response regulator [Prevotella sp.]